MLWAGVEGAELVSEHNLLKNMLSSLALSSSVQFNYICIASITILIVSRSFSETQSMTPEQILLTEVILLNSN